MEFLFGLRMLAEQIPGPGEGNGGGLVPGQQEGQDFVAQLAVGHAAAIFVAGRHEHGEQVARVLSAGPALKNDAVHDFVELAHRPLDPDHGRHRDVAHDGRQNHAAAGSVAHQNVQRSRHPFRVCFHFDSEKDLGDDAHGELHHFLMDVAGFALLPAGQHFFGEGGHRIAVRRHALAMEGGLAQAALPQPSRAFVGQQALAQEPAAVLDDFVLGEILRLRDQDLLDEAGMIEEINIHPGRTVVKDVAKFAGPAGVDGQRIGIE